MLRPLQLRAVGDRLAGDYIRSYTADAHRPAAITRSQLTVPVTPQDGQILCGTAELTRAQARSVQRQMEATVRAYEDLRLPRPKRIEIPVVFHITNPAIPDSKVVSELARVNRSFKSRGFRFPLKSIERYSQNEPSVVDFRKNCFNGDYGWNSTLSTSMLPSSDGRRTRAGRRRARCRIPCGWRGKTRHRGREGQRNGTENEPRGMRRAPRQGHVDGPGRRIMPGDR